MENGISLVVTYHPAFKNLSTTQRKNILYSDAKVERLTPSPFFACRSDQNLK